MLIPDAADTIGIFGFGLGLELPMVGVASGIAEKSEVGWGFGLGVGVSYDFWQRLCVRLTLANHQTYAGRATLRYSASGARVSKRQFADWSGLFGTLSGSYLFPVAGPWIPYAGIGVGVGSAGYLYHFDQQLDMLEPLDIDAVPRANTHPAYGRAVSAQAQGGIRLLLAPALAAQLELNVMHAWLGRRAVLNTREPREVVAPKERVWLVSSAFSIRLLF